jgi:hypothetical protein
VEICQELRSSTEYQDLGKPKKDIILFAFSSIVFGIVLSFLAWAIPFFVPSWLLPSYVLTASIILLLILGGVAFRLLMPQIRIQDAVDCYFVYDTKRNEVLYSTMLNYGFWNVASEYFHKLMSSKSEFKDLLRRPLDLRDNLLMQFMIFAIVHWLVLIRYTTFFEANRLAIAIPPRIFHSSEEMQRIDYTTFSLKNVFLELNTAKGGPLSSVMLPRSVRLEVTEDGVTLRNRYLTVALGFYLLQQSPGVDVRIENLLGLEKGNAGRYYGISAAITFDARLNTFWWILPKAKTYWTFAKDLNNNLRVQYGWSLMLNDAKEALIWETLTKVEHASLKSPQDSGDTSE